jgi:hypothetical protein
MMRHRDLTDRACCNRAGGDGGKKKGSKKRLGKRKSSVEEGPVGVEPEEEDEEDEMDDEVYAEICAAVTTESKILQGEYTQCACAAAKSRARRTQHWV